MSKQTGITASVVEAINEIGGAITISDLDDYFDQYSRQQIQNALFNSVQTGKIKKISKGSYHRLSGEIPKKPSVNDPIPNQPSLSASEIGDALIGMLERLKQENKRLTIDLRREVETKAILQERLNSMRMSQRTLSIKEITGR